MATCSKSGPLTGTAFIKLMSIIKKINVYRERFLFFCFLCCNLKMISLCELVSKPAPVGAFQQWARTHLLLYHKQWHVSSVWSAGKLFKPSTHKRLSNLHNYTPYNRICEHCQLTMFVQAMVQGCSVLSFFLVTSQCLKETFVKRKSREHLMSGWERGILGKLLQGHLCPGSHTSQFHVLSSLLPLIL